MKIHFIGIGGIGTSALAQYYLAKGHEVSGSDLVMSEITDMVAKKGVKIFEGNSADNISKSIDLVVHSPAVPVTNPEYKAAKDSGIKTQSYPEALGDLTKEFYTIAVSGSHGKSTTTAMIGLMMERAGLDPTVIIGTKVKEFGNSNFREGNSKYLVIEACEYDSSFLHYAPAIIVITNVDKEHLDYFKTFENVKRAFRDFADKLPSDGHLIENTAINIKIKNLLQVPGEHNELNASQAFEVGKILGIDEKIILESLAEFKGTWRRFEVKQGFAGNKEIIVVSDYGHHPNEVAATLKAAREKYGAKKIWCVFQPHQYQRTYYLFDDFVKIFKAAPIDKTIITDIYDVAGREVKEISQDVSSKKIVDEVAKDSVIYLELQNIAEHLKQNMQTGDVLVVMGAGDIYKLADEF